MTFILLPKKITQPIQLEIEDSFTHVIGIKALPSNRNPTLNKNRLLHYPNSQGSRKTSRSTSRTKSGYPAKRKREDQSVTAGKAIL